MTPQTTPEPLPGHWVDRAATAPGAGARAAAARRPRAAWLRDALAIAEALFLTDDGPPGADELAWLGEQLADFVAKVGPRSRFVLKASVVALAVFAPLAARRPVPLARLPLARRVEALARLERSPLSLNVLAVKAALCILWYEHPEHARQVGLTPGRPVRPDRTGAARAPRDGGVE